MLSEQTELDQFTIRIEQIQQFIGIVFFGGGKQDHLEPLRDAFEKLFEIRPRTNEHLVVETLEQNVETERRILDLG